MEFNIDTKACLIQVKCCHSVKHQIALLGERMIKLSVHYDLRGSSDRHQVSHYQHLEHDSESQMLSLFIFQSNQGFYVKQKYTNYCYWTWVDKMWKDLDYNIIVYWLKYGKNSLICLVERQSVHRSTDRRRDQWRGESEAAGWQPN